jgi:hypothetical protein
MQRNKVHHVHTVGRVAKDLGVDEDRKRLAGPLCGAT